MVRVALRGRMGRVRPPDGHGIWVEDHVLVGFFLGYDRGTERLDRLVTKLGGYAELAEVEPDPVLVLFVLASHRREAGVRQALTKALAAPTHAGPEAGRRRDGDDQRHPCPPRRSRPVWLLLDHCDGGHRQRLRELARHAALVSLD
jgi:hypothetical protein